MNVARLQYIGSSPHRAGMARQQRKSDMEKINFNPDDFGSVDDFLDAVAAWVAAARDAHMQGKPLPTTQGGDGGGPG